METLTQSKIELNEQILFSKGEGLFIGRIVEMREKAIRVDYCFSSCWSSGAAVTVFEYSTWMPKSVVINSLIGDLTVKKWFAVTGLQKAWRIKKYFVENEKQIFI